MSSQKELTPGGAKVTTIVTSADAVVAAPAEPGAGEHGESTLGGALADNAEHAAAAIKNLSPTLPPEIGVTFYTEEALAGAAFVGHLMTDLDSVAGAIGGALLYGGVATCAPEVNTETAFALDYWKIDRPPPVDSVLTSDPSNRICFIDGTCAHIHRARRTQRHWHCEHGADPRDGSQIGAPRAARAILSTQS